MRTDDPTVRSGYLLVLQYIWRDARAAESGGLENRCVEKTPWVQIPLPPPPADSPGEALNSSLYTLAISLDNLLGPVIHFTHWLPLEALVRF